MEQKLNTAMEEITFKRHTTRTTQTQSTEIALSWAKQITQWLRAFALLPE